MEFAAWEPEYRSLLREFQFSAAGDRRSAARLAELLQDRPRAFRGAQAEEELRRRLDGHDVLIVGGAPGPLPLPLTSSGLRGGPWSVLAADGATSRCLRAGTVPDMIVSDLDGAMPDELRANERGALFLAHAHGDNLPAVEEWVPRLNGSLVGTCACAPFGGLLNPGGFTDGDRALFLAEAFGVRRALLAGFDFVNVEAEPAASREIKRRKLAAAQRLVESVARRGHLTVRIVDAAGKLNPYLPE